MPTCNFNNSKFNISYDDGTGLIDGISYTFDKDGLNFVESPIKLGFIEGEREFTKKRQFTWKSVWKKLSVEKTFTLSDEEFKLTYVFKNDSDSDVNIAQNELAVFIPFNDNYDVAKVCLKSRCHAHIWCGEDTSYIYSRRMNAGKNNLAVILTSGASDGYKVERPNDSNHRGAFAFCVSPFTLACQESKKIEFTFFWIDGEQDFINKCKAYPKMNITRENSYTFLRDEYEKTYTADKVANKNNDADKSQEYENAILNRADGKGKPSQKLNLGERIIPIFYGENYKTFKRYNIIENPKTLIKKRLDFLISNQQCYEQDSVYYGGFYLYDNELKKKYVVKSPTSDHNAARERVGIINALAKYASINSGCDEKIEKSLTIAEHFVSREIVDESGTVYDDVSYSHAGKWHRKYNYSFYALMYLLMYELKKDYAYLYKCYQILKKFYELGGEEFYAFLLPIEKMCKYMRQENPTLYEDIYSCFIKHGERILKNGLNYPAHEVRFEQSIVMPAAEILLSCYNISGDNKYLKAAKSHIQILECFNGIQPDFHLNDIAIRHWDGYWFGKSKMYGDTFPHYWSGLTAVVFNKYGNIIKDGEYIRRANEILKANLCFFKEDGSASCAYIYPAAVNGKEGRFYDAAANDQDWALYLYLEYFTNSTK